MIEPAIALYQAARFQDALDLARQALAQVPEDVAWLNIAAACARALGLHGSAEAYWREAIRLRPAYAEAHNNLGILLKELKRPAEAEACYRAAIALRPDYVEAHHNLALLLTEAGRRGEAEACYRRALEFRPDSTGIGLNLVALLQERRDWDEVVACCQRVLERQPGCAEAYNSMGLALKELERHGEAEASYRQALALRPDYVAALGNLGGMLNGLKRRDEAEPYLRQAMALNPNIPEVHYNLGVLCYGARRYDEAEACYRRALELRPGYVGAEWNLSALLLLLGRFEEGWRRYEIRYHADRHGGKAAVPDLPCPPWRGQALAGKSLVVWPEQGFGDAIQFCRYLRPLKRLGAARITLVCKPPLLSLLRTLEDADAVVSLAEAAQLPPHDYWMLALSAPLYCGTIAVELIPAELPYLSAPPGRCDHWASKLRALTGKRVGLVWKGSATNGNDAHRSLPGLDLLAPLWRVPGVSFVSLQKGQAEDEAAAPPRGQPLLALGGEVRDFADSAAVLVQLDLLISVDTATAHLAGALGVPCWVMLPAEGLDWRWLLERSDSPWYPGALRLFRQAVPGDWGPVIAAVAAALRDFQPGSASPPRWEAEPLAARLARLSAADFELVRALVDRLADPGA
ncbi:Tfp pilus assembly protein PilF [Methylomagnum ishizawai]|uniref:Tfp pilus assembly protein PilF n=1 Tax=Methylomagnum ishizawai TaxID=1760988 RepID=A0A1Y6D319_9GAMM|nr:tetratricopeptide repeat-containing glycosyltransferase family protein [Methylomagnum ishizawai]SMF97047.1 Tfp pilus assembly protein PilF [Methylomagnum ishizawai]